MLNRAYEIFAKSLSKDLQDDEKEYIHEYNARYAIVRFLYMEKMQGEKSGVVDFHFTPGDGFMETPIIDIVNELMKINDAIKNGKVKELNFGDLRFKKSNPPHTGREKTKL